MIVTDGRSDREKLFELLAVGEQTSLEYKSTLDLAVGRDRLNLVKDIVAMSNRPGGGYILVGVDNTGRPCLPIGTLERPQFDGANLGQIVRKHIEGQIEVHSQVHEVDGDQEVVLIQIEGHRDGLPVPMAKVGQYRNEKGKDVTVFREGDVLVREGSSNVPLRHSHWADLLVERDRKIREQAEANVQELIAQVVEQLRSTEAPRSAAAPLALGLDETTLAEAVVSHLEIGNDIRLQQLLLQARNVVTSARSTADATVASLDAITIVGAQAIFFGRDVEFRAAVDALHSIYEQAARDRGTSLAPLLLAVVTRANTLGSLALRCGRWSSVRHVVQKPVRSSTNSAYVYSTWLRHGQVEASRAELFPDRNAGMVISAARALVADHPAMRPDVPDDALPHIAELDETDLLLNSLCEFDLAYCLVVAAEGQGRGGGYPACAAFHQHRADPTFVAIATETTVREALFPDSTDARIATALRDVHESASRESWKSGGYWSELPAPAQAFVVAQLDDPAQS